ncbi:MAG: GspE/PulE family protein [bacterium]|nr:GspE/PulE family protein [bacterium]
MIKLPPQTLRDLLVREGILDEKTFASVEEEAALKRQDVADLLVFRGLVNSEYLLTIIAKALGVPRIDFTTARIDENALRLLPEDIARQRHCIIFGRTDEGLLMVAMEDPTNLETIDFLALRLQARIVPYLASPDDLSRGYSLYEQRLTEDFKAVIERSVQESLRSKAHGDPAKAAEDLPVVAILENLLSYGVSSRASDIHFESLDDAVLVRYRIDGILHEVIRMPKEVHAAIIARVKILANLRVDEHTHPQDGRFRHRIGESVVDVRVSVIPTFYGEKVEFRLLTATQKPLSLAEIGLSERHEALIRSAISKTYGMVLVTGPTGSGKTTTLYSILSLLNRPEVNIVTIEDPIEYDMRYVNQMQVNVAAGITFASGLRAILRQDPNIVMVGEIRDGETANIGVQAALTGHLVLSSLHTNDAPTAVPRLADMGVPPFLIAAVLNTVVAQRLVRRVHLACVESYVPDTNVVESVRREFRALAIDPERVRLPKTFYRGRGCAACGFTGYLGRIGIYEALEVTEPIRQLIMGASFSLDALRQAARAAGMVTMFEDGVEKLTRGLTTVEEVFRVVRE